jgi:hypothetical protein
MAQRVACLLLSQEKFLRGAGNGSSSLDSPTHTGSPESAGMRKVPALFLPSPTLNPWPFPKGDSFQRRVDETLERNLLRNGSHGDQPTKPLSWLELQQRIQNASS